MSDLLNLSQTLQNFLLPIWSCYGCACSNSMLNYFLQTNQS